MPKPLLTIPARLNLLLPWLKGTYDEHVWGPNPLYGQPGYGAGEGPEDFATRTDYAAIRQVLDAFVRSFDGSAEAAHVVAEPNDTAAALDDEAIDYLEAGLKILLDQGIGEPSLQDADIASLPLGSLRLMVRGAGRRNPTLGKFDVTKGGSPLRKGLVKRLRDYRAAGAYVLRVVGPMRDLVPFLWAHLLTTPNMVSVKRCERRTCSHFVITAIAKRGRPQRFCSVACRETNREQVKEEREKERQRKRRQS